MDTDDYWVKRDEEDDTIIHEGEIGSGGYAEVHKVFARKLIRSFGGRIAEVVFKNEVRAIERLCNGTHENIIEVFRHGRLRARHALYFIDMEWCDASLEGYIDGGQSISGLLNWLEIPMRDKTRQILDVIIKDVVNGLIYIHNRNEVHRDLTPANSTGLAINILTAVLYSNKSRTWKIADFGLTSEGSTTQPRTTPYGRGKPGYRAPELVLDPKQTYNKKVDIWSLGCILFEMCTGKKAFVSDGAVLEFSRRSRKFDVTLPEIGEPENTCLVALIRRTLESSPKKRPSALLVQRTVQEIRHFQSTDRRNLTGQFSSASFTPQIPHAQVVDRDGELASAVGNDENTTGDFEALFFDGPGNEPSDLSTNSDEQIKAIEYLLMSTEDNESDILRGDRLHNLSVALHSRFKRTGTMEDLNRSIALNRQVVESTPNYHPDLVIYLSSFASVLLSNFDRTGDPDSLDEAIVMAEQAVDSTSVDDPNRASRLNNLGAVLHSRFKRTGLMIDLQRSVSVIELAVASIPNDHPDRTMFLNSLGKVLHTRFERTGSTDDLDRAIRCNEEALAVVVAPPSLRIRAADSASQLLDRDFRRSQPLLRSAVELLPTISPRQLKLSDQQHNISPFIGLTAKAVSVSLECDEDPYNVLQLLELGRGVLVSLRLDLRYDISGLSGSHPNLAARFKDACLELDQVWTDEEGPMRLVESTYSDFRHDLSESFDALLKTIREIPGYENFLRGPSKSDLKLLAERGPVVALNVSRMRCDAFLIEIDGVRVVHLSRLRFQDLENMTRKFLTAISVNNPRRYREAQSSMSAVLEWLWDVAIEPIMNALGITGPPSVGSDWPRVWWVPSGLLNLLPIHAAGYHNIDGGKNLIDRVISSYAPTLKSLRHADIMVTTAAPRDVAHQRALLVGMPETMGQANLPYVKMELEKLGQLISGGISTDILEGPTKDKVLSVLKEHQIVHFACHGYPSADPSQSRLLLSDWKTSPLTVADVMSVKLQRAQFAFLSACHTSSTSNLELLDESINLSSAMQLAGYPSVVGTLWKIDDRISANLSLEVYKFMWDGTKLDTCRSAEALHFAIRSLRNETRNRLSFDRGVKVLATTQESSRPRVERPSPSDPLIWAPYVHIGV